LPDGDSGDLSLASGPKLYNVSKVTIIFSDAKGYVSFWWRRQHIPTCTSEVKLSSAIFIHIFIINPSSNRGVPFPWGSYSRVEP
jgi:hypothetical protein